MMMVRARCFSARRCAAVAPTLPAPTTATVPSMPDRFRVCGWWRNVAITAGWPESIRSGFGFQPRRQRLAELSEPLVQDDAHRVGQVEAAHVSGHRNSEA